MEHAAKRSIAGWRPALIGLAGMTIATLAGCVSLGRSELVEDGRSRFSFRVSTALESQPTDGSYFHYRMTDQAIHAYVIPIEDSEEDRAISAALQISGLVGEPGENGTAAMGDWTLRKYLVAETDTQAAIAYQLRNGTLYALIVRAEDPDVDPGVPPLPIMRVLESITFTEAAGEVFKPADAAQLEDYLGREVTRYGGSVSIAALYRGEVVYTFAIGERYVDTPTDASVAYNWGSISKLVTATAVMQQVEAGRIRLDAPIAAYLPEFPVGDKVRVRNLLTHTSGLKDSEVVQIIGLANDPLPSLESTLKGYLPGATELGYEPGTVFSYNNWNFLLLAVIVERVSGVSFAQYAAHNILEPLGMGESAYRTADLSVPAARSILSVDAADAFLHVMKSHGKDGEAMITDKTDRYLYLDHYDILPAWAGLMGSARDAVRFASLFLNGEQPEEAQVLKRATVQTMLTMQKSNSGTALGCGLAWFLGRDARGAYAQHAGGGPGINALLRVYPKKDLAVAVMGNTNDYKLDKILAFAADLVLAGVIRQVEGGQGENTEERKGRVDALSRRRVGASKDQVEPNNLIGGVEG